MNKNEETYNDLYIKEPLIIKQINYAYTKNEPDEYFYDEDDEMVGRLIRIEIFPFKIFK